MVGNEEREDQNETHDPGDEKRNLPAHALVHLEQPAYEVRQSFEEVDIREKR